VEHSQLCNKIGSVLGCVYGKCLGNNLESL
jgi:hypothetical protein